MTIKETAARYKASKDNKVPGQIVMSFSANCISIPECKCWRCMVDNDLEPDDITEKIAEVHALLQKFKFKLSTMCIAKSDSDRISTVNFALADLKINASLIEKLPKITMTKIPVEIATDKYTRSSVTADKNSLYIFTDNNTRTSKPDASTENVDKDLWYYKKYSLLNFPIHFGTINNPTSAVIRGLNNAYPISTMSAYGKNWLPREFDLFKSVIDDEIEQIKKDLYLFKRIKLANSRIGQGGKHAKIPTQLQEYLDKRLAEIGIDNTGEYPKAL